MIDKVALENEECRHKCGASAEIPSITLAVRPRRSVLPEDGPTTNWQWGRSPLLRRQLAFNLVNPRATSLDPRCTPLSVSPIHSPQFALDFLDHATFGIDNVCHTVDRQFPQMVRI